MPRRKKQPESSVREDVVEAEAGAEVESPWGAPSSSMTPTSATPATLIPKESKGQPAGAVTQVEPEVLEPEALSPAEAKALVSEPEPVANAGVPVRTTGWLQCPVHTHLTYQVGGFCTECYADQTLMRVRSMDEAFSQMVQAATGKLVEILRLPVEAHNHELLNPLLRAIGMIERRFKRPEQINVHHKSKVVAIVGSPVDFQQAAQKAAEKQQSPVV